MNPNLLAISALYLLRSLLFLREYSIDLARILIVYGPSIHNRIDVNEISIQLQNNPVTPLIIHWRLRRSHIDLRLITQWYSKIRLVHPVIESIGRDGDAHGNDKVPLEFQERVVVLTVPALLMVINCRVDPVVERRYNLVFPKVLHLRYPKEVQMF